MSQLVEMSDLANDLRVLTSKEYPLKWRVVCLDYCYDDRMDDMDEMDEMDDMDEMGDMDEISPEESIQEIMKGRDLEIYLCNDEPDREPLIGLSFNNGVYLYHGFGGEGGTEDPADNALVRIQDAVSCLKEMPLSDDQVRATWLSIFQVALDVNSV